MTGDSGVEWAREGKRGGRKEARRIARGRSRRERWREGDGEGRDLEALSSSSFSGSVINRRLNRFLFHLCEW